MVKLGYLLTFTKNCQIAKLNFLSLVLWSSHVFVLYIYTDCGTVSEWESSTATSQREEEEDKDEVADWLTDHCPSLQVN